MKKLILLALLLWPAVAEAQWTLPAPFKTQTGGGGYIDTLWANSVRVGGNLTVYGSFAGAPSTVADSLRANLKFFMGGPAITKILVGSFTHDWANITAGTTLDETQTITGPLAAENWIVLVGPVTDISAGLILQAGARVSADNTIKMRMANKCGADVDNASQSFWYILVRY